MGKISFKRLFIWFLTFFSLLFLIGGIFFFFYTSTAPEINKSQLSSENATQIYDSQGNRIYTVSREDRDYATQSEVPKSLKKAVVAIEDRRFYKHHGIDLYRISGASLRNIKDKITGNKSAGLQGGSTLTQQLVKLSVFSTKKSDQTLRRKAQEAWLALKVERNYSKNQILTFYINKVNMGNNIYGMKTAAEYYFGKSLKSLDNSQIAILASIPRSPVLYNPYQYPNNLKYRRNQVLKNEEKMGTLNNNQVQLAMKEPIQQGLVPAGQNKKTSSDQGPIYDAYIQSALNEAKKLGYNTNKSGLKIYTSLNKNLQNYLYKDINGQTGVPWQNGIQAAATVTNPQNGQVMAQIGGRNNNQILGLNRAVQTNRSSGSTAKPLVDYGPALEYFKWPTYYAVKDTPYKYPGTKISVHDFDGRFMGKMTMRKALKISRNIPAIRTLMTVGMVRSSNFLSKLGISIKPSNLTPSSAIGINLSTQQEAAAFSTFANGGTYYSPKYIQKIKTADGKSHNYPNQGTKAIKKSTAFMMANMLKGVPKYNGSAPNAQISGLNQAGKSGIVGYSSETNQPAGAASDVWYTGFTKYLAASFWSGYDEPNKRGNYIPNSSESSMPEKAYKDFMMNAVRIYKNTDWNKNTNWKKPKSVGKVQRKNVTQYVVKNSKWGRNSSLINNRPNKNSSASPFSSSSSKKPNSASSYSQKISSNNSSSLNNNRNSSSSQTSRSQKPSSNSSSSSTNSSSTSSSNVSSTSNTPSYSSSPSNSNSNNTTTTNGQTSASLSNSLNNTR